MSVGSTCSALVSPFICILSIKNSMVNKDHTNIKWFTVIYDFCFRLPFRMLVRKYDCDIAFTPMIIADSFVKSLKARDNEFTTCKGICIYMYFHVCNYMYLHVFHFLFKCLNIMPNYLTKYSQTCVKHHLPIKTILLVKAFIDKIKQKNIQIKTTCLQRPKSVSHLGGLCSQVWL